MTAAVLLALALTSTRPSLVSEELLSPEARIQLRNGLARARLNSPRVFEQLEALHASMKGMNERRRGRRVPVAIYLSTIAREHGRDALWPLLGALTLRVPGIPLEPEAAEALELGLLETIGRLRDPRAVPVLQAALRRPSSPSLRRAAAAALAKCGGAAVVPELLRLAEASGADGRAVRAALGATRHPAAVERLATRLAHERDPNELGVLIEALGEAGAAWGWAASGKEEPNEVAVREGAARALVQAWTTHRGELRAAAARALLLVDAPGTAELLEGLRANAGPETAKSIDNLLARWRANRLR